MITEDLGLSSDGLTWLLWLGIAALWVCSLRGCTSWRKDGWVSLPMSLFGFAWLGYGVDTILRFALLSYDSVTYGNLTYRLANRPASVVNETLALSGLYWLCVCIGFVIAGSRKTAGPFRVLRRLTPENMARPLNLITIAALLSLIVRSVVEVPLLLFTPMGLITSLWVIPATVVWYWHFRKTDPQLDRRSLRTFLLLPGALLVITSPYREHIFTMMSVIFIAAIFAGRQFRLSRVAFIGFALLLSSTVLIEAYRGVLWLGGDIGETLAQERWRSWSENTYDSPWNQVLRRFHGFDSLLLTVDLVPRVLPHSDRNVFLDLLVQAVIPRALYQEKQLAQRGREFSRTIWAYDEGGEVREAAIAPSMPGDLYEAGGIGYVAAGAFVWGLLLGLLEGWKRNLTPGMAAAITVLFGMQCAFATERDFVFATASLIQGVLVLNLVMYFLPVKQRQRQVDVSLQADEIETVGPRIRR